MGHPVPDAIDALLALWGAAPELGGGKVQVDDGPPIEGIDVSDSLGVGLGVQDAGGSQVTSATSYGYGGGRDHSFDVTCVAQSWSGGTDLAPLRARVYEIFGAAVSLLDLNRDLGEVVDWARMVRHTYRAVQDERGALALIEFTVRVDAHREGA